MTIIAVLLRLANTVGWTTDDDQPAQWRQHGKRSLPLLMGRLTTLRRWCRVGGMDCC
jgi:hypothetical protein